MAKPKKPPNTWPKVWRLSKTCTVHLHRTGVLSLPRRLLSKAEVRRLFVRLKGIYRD